jgi:hypothetical protein
MSKGVKIEKGKDWKSIVHLKKQGAIHSKRTTMDLESYTGDLKAERLKYAHPAEKNLHIAAFLLPRRRQCEKVG